MYTQCPDCQTAFQVTAKVLQQAGGKVRCGGCGNAFSALDFLSEDLPETLPAQSASPDPGDASVDDETFARQTSELLETLDELAGPEDIRIEDTGIEWRVLDAVVQDSLETGDTSTVPVYSESPTETGENSEDSPAEKPLDLRAGDPENFDPSEMRFDDNTPLPDDFDDFAEEISVPMRRTDDSVEEPTQVVDDLQEDLELGAPDDWEQLLDEVAAGTSDNKGAVETIHGDLSAPPDTRTEQSLPIDDSPTTDVPLYVEAGDIDEIESPGNDGVTEATQAESAEGELPADQDYRSLAEDDDLEGDEESASFAALRESTGAFEKQIAVAQDELRRQLDGNFDEEPDDLIDDIAEESDTESAGEHQEFADDPIDDEAEIVGWGDGHELAGDETEDALDLAADDAEQESGIEVEIAAEAVADHLADDDEPETTELEDDDLADYGISISDDVREASNDNDSEVESDAESDEEDETVDLSEATIAGVPASLLAEHEDSANVETIIMEGEFIRGSIEKQRLADDHSTASQLDEPASLADTYAIQRGLVRGGRRRGDPNSLGMMAIIVALVLVLVAQFVHTNREMLSTYGAFNQTLGPIYRVVGSPVTPQWNIKGWQFEATNGATDEEEQVLTIFSRIINRSDTPLPYPLVHVSLTDRWEEIIGSRVLEPGEYLAGNLDPSKPVAAGENFTAVVTVASPSPEATGFKLNVCYRVSPGRVRCATEDFKD